VTDADDDTFILARLGDPAAAGRLREMLLSDGIAVSTPGLMHRWLVGFQGAYIEVIVRVRNADRERAERIYEAFRTPASAEEIASLDAEEPHTDRLRRVAVFAACTLTFGSGHFYARRWRSGWIILAAQLACLGLAFAWPVFAFALAGIVLADVLGSVLSVGADQRGEATSVLARSGPVLAVLAIAAVPGARSVAPGVFAGRAMSAACARASECGSAESVDACVARAADATFAGRSFGDRDEVCAECLDESLCEDARLDCPECDALVSLPMPEPIDRARGPAGTSADDMPIVIPDLFGHDLGDPARTQDLDVLLRGLDDRSTER
jgi:hypothetical protein